MQRAVDRLTDRLSEAGRQIHDHQQNENDLREKLELAERSIDELTARCDDIEQQLKHETETREYLSLEFYKADG
jgi:predicted  nucleic acid-binding Zn-ribbon protein